MRPVARIAQSVEQGIENPRVRGSIPRPGTNILKTQPLWLGFCFCGFLKHLYVFSAIKSINLDACALTVCSAVAHQIQSACQVPFQTR